MVFTSCKGANAKMSHLSYLSDLPESIGVWTRVQPDRTVDSTNIFKYMNGAGELYLGYRFNHLQVFDYTSEDQDNILVELYFMETSNDAFGLLSLDWGGEPVSFDRSFPSHLDNSLTSGVRALYGAGLLRIWSDKLYIRIMASRETSASRQAVLFLGREITKNQKYPSEPELLQALSPYIDSKYKLRKDRLSFFRSYLALNTIYYLSHENILNFDLLTEAVIVPYEHIADTGDQIRSQFLLVKYENHLSALKALEHFHNVYLPEHKKEFTANLSVKGLNLFKIENGWTGYQLINNYAAIVFECPDQKSTRDIIKAIAGNLGGDHER